MAVGALEIIEHRKQLVDHDRLPAFPGRLLIAQCPLAVIGEVGLNPLQISEQFGRLVGLLRSLAREGPRRRPTGGWAGGGTFADFSGLRVDATLIGDSHRFVAIPVMIRMGHLVS